MFNGLLKIYQHRNVLFQTTRNDIKMKYAGSYLGKIWVLLYPILFLGSYASMYIFVFKVRYNELDTIQYVALIFSGLIPFLGFSESLNGGTVSVTGNVSLLKNTLFPIEMVPVKTVFLSQFSQMINMTLLMLFLIATGNFRVESLVIIVVWLLQIIYLIGLVWIVSCINVFFRDFQNIISLVTIMLMMLTPIAYPMSMAPEGFKTIMAFNPLYYIVRPFQEILVLGQLTDYTVIGKLVALSFGTFVLGYYVFMSLKKVFLDNV